MLIAVGANRVLYDLAGLPGQLGLAVLGVLALMLIKGVVRKSDKQAVRRDDFAIGLDLLVLALITLASGAVAASVLYHKLQAAKSPNGTMNGVLSKEINDLLFMAVVVAALFLISYFIQRQGWMSESARNEWQGRNPPEKVAPELRLLAGVLIPASLGLFLLVISIRIATAI